MKKLFSFVLVFALFTTHFHSEGCSADYTLVAPADASELFPRLRGVSEDFRAEIRALDKEASAAEQRNYIDLARKRREAALSLCEQKLGKDHFVTTMHRKALEQIDWLARLSDQDRATVNAAKVAIATSKVGLSFAEQARKLQTAVDALRQVGSPESAELISAQLSCAEFLVLSGDLRGLEMATIALDASITSYGAESRVALRGLLTCARLTFMSAQEPEAMKLFCRALRLANKLQTLEASDYPESIIGCYDILFRLEDYERASRCLDAFDKSLLDHPAVSLRHAFKSKCSRAQLSMVLSRFDDARNAINACNDMVKDLAPTGEWFVSQRTKAMEGQLALAQNNIKDADLLITSYYDMVSKYNLAPKDMVDESVVNVIKLLMSKMEYAAAAKLASSTLGDIAKAERTMTVRQVPFARQYVAALKKLNRSDEVKRLEKYLGEIDNETVERRRIIKADPDCKLPWEQ